MKKGGYNVKNAGFFKSINFGIHNNNQNSGYPKAW